MSTSIKLAWRNMWRNWRRTAIALVAIVLGVILLLFFDGLIHGSDQAIFGNAVRLYGGNIQIHAQGFRVKANRLPLLPLEDANMVLQIARAEPDVVAAAPRINTTGIVSSHGDALPVGITAIDPTVEASISLQAQNISQGRFLQASDRDTILIGQGLADRLQIGLGDPITLVGRRKDEFMRQHTMTVVGIYNLHMPNIEKTAVFIMLADAQTLYNLRDQTTEVVIFLKTVGSEETTISTLQAQLPGSEVDSWQTLRPEIRQTLDTKFAFSSFFGVVILLIASIGILNLMLMSVFERTREMGVLAALGMKGWQITNLFLLEGAMIGIVGAVIGCSLGALLVWGVGQVGIDLSSASGMGEIMALMGNRLYPSLTLTDLLNRGALVIIIAAIAALYPSWQASRKEPAQALHHV
ncbi:MAG: FtsX-like permease family protein [Roseiflexaceae bacterium]|nr:FtsX-like permease family protein [Roseiflexaceae bacterium]